MACAELRHPGSKLPCRDRPASSLKFRSLFLPDIPAENELVYLGCQGMGYGAFIIVGTIQGARLLFVSCPVVNGGYEDNFDGCRRRFFLTASHTSKPYMTGNATSRAYMGIISSMASKEIYRRCTQNIKRFCRKNLFHRPAKYGASFATSTLILLSDRRRPLFLPVENRSCLSS
jgi:hypothetical protein